MQVVYVYYYIDYYKVIITRLLNVMVMRVPITNQTLCKCIQISYNIIEQWTYNRDWINI
jgi:hypothetical protein